MRIVDGVWPAASSRSTSACRSPRCSSASRTRPRAGSRRGASVNTNPWCVSSGLAGPGSLPRARSLGTLQRRAGVRVQPAFELVDRNQAAAVRAARSSARGARGAPGSPRSRRARAPPPASRAPAGRSRTAAGPSEWSRAQRPSCSSVARGGHSPPGRISRGL
jgi:hypothetical protein